MSTSLTSKSKAGLAPKKVAAKAAAKKAALPKAAVSRKVRLVGQFPSVIHFSAPEHKRLIEDKQLKLMVQAMQIA